MHLARSWVLLSGHYHPARGSLRSPPHQRVALALGVAPLMVSFYGTLRICVLSTTSAVVCVPKKPDFPKKVGRVTIRSHEMHHSRHRRGSIGGAVRPRG